MNGRTKTFQEFKQKNTDASLSHHCGNTELVSDRCFLRTLLMEMVLILGIMDKLFCFQIKDNFTAKKINEILFV